jgi:hypothetical protein
LEPLARFVAGGAGARPDHPIRRRREIVKYIGAAHD